MANDILSDADVGLAELSDDDVGLKLPSGTKLTKFVPESAAGLPKRELPPSNSTGKDTTDYAGQSLLGELPRFSGAGTTAPAVTIPIAAAANTASGALEYATSPRGLGMIGAASTPAAPAVYAKWAYDMLKGGVESVKDAGEAVANLIKGHINSQMAAQLGEKSPPVDQAEIQRLADDAVNTAVGLIGGTAAGVHGAVGATKLITSVANTVRSAGAPATAAALERSDAIHDAGKAQPTPAPTGEGQPQAVTQPAPSPALQKITQEGIEEGVKLLQEEVGLQEAEARRLVTSTNPRQTLAEIEKELGLKFTEHEKQVISAAHMPDFEGTEGAIMESLKHSSLTQQPKMTPEQRLRLEGRLNRAVQEGVLGPEPAKPEASPQQPNQPKGIAGSVRNKWTQATESPLGSEAGFINIDPLKDFVEGVGEHIKTAARFVKEVGKEQANIRKLGDYGKGVLNWSAKLQQSFQEAGSAQREIQQKVPDTIRREGITNWIQADGDAAVLQQRLGATADPKLRKGYEAALSLTPEEIGVANDVRNAYNGLGARGLAYDVLKSFKDNYVTQIWDLKKGPQFAGSRTLRDKFRFSKASTFPTFFDGEQAGYTPKTKDISKLLPVYLHEMNSVIAARQLVQELSSGVASDGRPLVVPRGAGTPVSGPSGQATLITPKSIKGDTGDYKTLPNQPALNDWRWAAKDAAGNPIFLKADLALHPEAYAKIRNVLGKSAIREWYQSRTSAAAQIPKSIVQGIDMANAVTKRTMLGLLSPFHQVQEGTHGVGHRVNPTFNIPKVDLVNDAGQMDAARHGLMLAPDRVSAEQFMEGFRQSGLVSRIPVIGPLADHYSNYLFHQYIPGLKYKTYQAIQSRNMGVYAKDIASGKVSEADVKHLSAEQANAAYGHLNYADLARNPTIQHIMQLGLLAPDFFEARARFAGQSVKGVTGAKVGREQIIALATLAVAQATTAYTAAQLTDGEWDASRPFEFHVGNRRYTMRSVPEDISSVLHDARAFAYSRISPIIGKGTAQYLSGVDYRGQKITPGETTKELLQQPIPISIRGFLGLGRQSLSGWEQLLSAVGLRVSRYSPANDVFNMAHEWMKNSGDPKTQKRLEIQQHSVFPESEYKSIRNALNDNNMNAAREAYDELLKTKTRLQVYRALAHPHPFTGNATSERQFVNSLDEDQRRIYDQAVNERKKTLNKFRQMTSGTEE